MSVIVETSGSQYRLVKDGSLVVVASIDESIQRVAPRVLLKCVLPLSLILCLMGPPTYRSMHDTLKQRFHWLIMANNFSVGREFQWLSKKTNTIGAPERDKAGPVDRSSRFYLHRDLRTETKNQLRKRFCHLRDGLLQ